MDELLTNISLYWFSGCITSSTRLYYETLGPLATGEGRSNFAKPVSVPCGIALFAKEPFAGRIQAWVEAAAQHGQVEPIQRSDVCRETAAAGHVAHSPAVRRSRT